MANPMVTIVVRNLQPYCLLSRV